MRRPAGFVVVFPLLDRLLPLLACITLVILASSRARPAGLESPVVSHRDATRERLEGAVADLRGGSLEALGRMIEVLSSERPHRILAGAQGRSTEPLAVAGGRGELVSDWAESLSRPVHLHLVWDGPSRATLDLKGWVTPVVPGPWAVVGSPSDLEVQLSGVLEVLGSGDRPTLAVRIATPPNSPGRWTPRGWVGPLELRLAGPGLATGSLELSRGADGHLGARGQWRRADGSTEILRQERDSVVFESLSVAGWQSRFAVRTPPGKPPTLIGDLRRHRRGILMAHLSISLTDGGALEGVWQDFAAVPARAGTFACEPEGAPQFGESENSDVQAGTEEPSS